MASAASSGGKEVSLFDPEKYLIKKFQKMYFKLRVVEKYYLEIYASLYPTKSLDEAVDAYAIVENLNIDHIDNDKLDLIVDTSFFLYDQLKPMENQVIHLVNGQRKKCALIIEISKSLNRIVCYAKYYLDEIEKPMTKAA